MSGTYIEVKAWRKKNPEKWKLQRERYRRKNPDKTKDKTWRDHLRRHYGISVEEYILMLAEQNGVCLVCKRHPLQVGKLHVDHDHSTDTLRGLLCGSCNRALGLLGEDPQRIRSLAEYVEMPR